MPKFNILKAYEDFFSKSLKEHLSWMDTGRLTFEGRSSRFDFEYKGNGKFPAPVPYALRQLQDWSDTETSVSQRFNDVASTDDFFDSTEVTFHELGHAISFALDGKPERINLRNYGWGSTTTPPASTTGKREALRQELRAFAVSYYLRSLTGLASSSDVSEDSALSTIDQDPWRGILTLKEKRQEFALRKELTPEIINDSLLQLSLHFTLKESYDRSCSEYIQYSARSRSPIDFSAEAHSHNVMPQVRLFRGH